MLDWAHAMQDRCIIHSYHGTIFFFYNFLCNHEQHNMICVNWCTSTSNTHQELYGFLIVESISTLIVSYCMFLTRCDELKHHVRALRSEAHSFMLFSDLRFKGNSSNPAAVSLYIEFFHNGVEDIHSYWTYSMQPWEDLLQVKVFWASRRQFSDRRWEWYRCTEWKRLSMRHADASCTECAQTLV